MDTVATDHKEGSLERRSFWKDDQKCSTGYVEFEMRFRPLSGGVKRTIDYVGLVFRREV